MNKKLLIAFYFIYLLSLLFLIIISVSSPLDNLISCRMAIETAVAVLLFFLLAFWWKSIYGKMNDKSLRILKRIGLLVVVIFGALLFALSISRSTFFNVLTDYSEIYRNALGLADFGTIESYDYFLRYTNNLRPMLFLSLLFGISHKLGICEFYPVLILSIITVLGTIWAICVLLSGERRSRWIFPAILMVMAYLPIYVFTPAFYTDTMSFGIGVIVLACLKKSLTGKHNFAFALLGGMLTVYGLMWKVTTLIPLIAGLICFLLKGVERFVADRRKLWRNMVIYALALLLSIGIMNIWSYSYPIYSESKECGHPAISWIALGMKGDGSYYSGMDYANRLLGMSSKTEKAEYTRIYIAEHLSEAFSIRHLYEKARYNFASGTLNCAQFLWVDNDGTFLWNLMAWWGKYYWYTSQWCFVYLFTSYTIVFFGGLKCFIVLIKGKDIPAMKIIADLSLFGIMFFLMIWEANCRQMYNQIPMIIINVFVSIEVLISSGIKLPHRQVK